MTVPVEELRNIFAELLVEAAEKRERRDHIAAIKDRLKKEKKDGIDWSQMRALAVAHDADQNPKEGDTKKHVAELIARRGYAEAYADIVLHVHVPEQIRQKHSYTPAARDSAAGVDLTKIEPTAASGGEAARPCGPHLTGRIEPASNPDLGAASTNSPTGSSCPPAGGAVHDKAPQPPCTASSFSDDFNDIPQSHRRTPDGGFVLQ